MTNTMTNDPWTVQGQRPRTYFAQVEVTMDEKQSARGGNSYWVIHFTIALLSGDNDLVERKMFSFGRDWNSITLPSLQALVSAGKLTHPSEIDGKYTRYTWKPWRDYSKNTVEYYETEKPEKLTADEKGKFFVEKTALFFEDVYADEDSAFQAMTDYYGGEVVNDEIPWESNGHDPAVNGFLTMFVKQSVGSDNKVDLDKLTVHLANNVAMLGSLTIDSPEVLAAIQQVEGEPPF